MAGRPGQLVCDGFPTGIRHRTSLKILEMYDFRRRNTADEMTKSKIRLGSALTNSIEHSRVRYELVWLNSGGTVNVETLCQSCCRPHVRDDQPQRIGSSPEASMLRSSLTQNTSFVSQLRGSSFLGSGSANMENAIQRLKDFISGGMCLTYVADRLVYAIESV